MGGVDAPAPIPGFETPEVFTNTVEFSQFFRRLIPVFVAMVLLVWLVVGLVLAAAGLGGLGWLVAAALAAGLGAVLYAAKKRQYEATSSTSKLVLAPSGVVSGDRYARTEMPWDRIHQIGPTDLLRPLRVNPGVGLAPAVGAKAAGAAAAASMRRSAEGLIGAGRLVVSPEAPRLVQAQVKQNDQGRELQPETGQPLRAIGLTKFDPNWRNGRIGEWVAAYRPDLFSAQLSDGPDSR